MRNVSVQSQVFNNIRSCLSLPFTLHTDVQHVTSVMISSNKSSDTCKVRFAKRLVSWFMKLLSLSLSNNPTRTCLHWACKRNHKHIVSYLLSCGADKDILTAKDELAAQLTSKPEIKRLLGGKLHISYRPVTCSWLIIIPVWWRINLVCCHLERF